MLRLGIAQINVTDARLAWEFYVEKLGFTPKRAGAIGDPFELDLGTGPDVLIYPVERMVARDYPDGTGVTLVFYTNDLEGTMSSWAGKGVEFIPISWSTVTSGVAETPYGPFIAFRDPFGNVHELLQPYRG